MKYTLEDARRIVLNCAKQYQNRLLDKKLLIIYRERLDNTIRYIEVEFHDHNYQHLTGLEFIDRNGHMYRGRSKYFFRKCIENKLTTKDIRFRKDGTAQLKLRALPVLMDITKVTKIAGCYNGSRPYLYVDKVIGNVHFCLGLSKTSSAYVPSSALLADIKELTESPSQVLAVIQKGCDDDIYATVKHVAKGLDMSNLTLPSEIRNKIDLTGYTYMGKKQ